MTERRGAAEGLEPKDNDSCSPEGEGRPAPARALWERVRKALLRPKVQRDQPLPDMEGVPGVPGESDALRTRSVLL